MSKEPDLSKLTMEDGVEHEICGNCKKEIPHFNYVMHTAHCARNITLCPICKEPIPKNQFEEHKGSHKTTTKPTTSRKIEEKVDFPRQLSKSHQNSGATPKKLDEFNLKDPGSKLKVRREKEKGEMVKKEENKFSREANFEYQAPKNVANNLLACRYCDLELVKLDLEDHENYCGSRTDKCNVCGELVMFKYKKLHEESNHGFLKLNDEPGPTASWDSSTQRSEQRREQPPPIYTVNSIDFSPLYRSYSNDYNLQSDEKRESYKDISRRLDWQAPQPPTSALRKPNPPTELTIPCEFCNTPIPHEDLIQHETGCRPDLARFNPKRRSPSPSDDDYFYRTQDETPQSPEVELPCEFCSDMFPASQLLRHQLSCN
nr:TRAF-type zinc finger domain-containing protein 1-like isoform X2 [Onthophagus taurus]